MSLITARRCCSWLLAPAVLCAVLAPACEDDPASGGLTPGPITPTIDGGQTPGNDAGETPTAKPNPLDALNPATGSFSADRDAALGLLAKGSEQGAANPNRLSQSSDPFHVISALEVLVSIAAEDPAACANAPGGCRQTTEPLAHLNAFSNPTVKASAKDLLVKTLDALDRWAMIAGVADALAYAHLLEQLGKLTPADVTRIKTAASVLTGKITTATPDTLDVRTIFSANDPTYFRLFTKIEPFKMPSADLVSSARAVIESVVGATPPPLTALRAPFVGDWAAPKASSPGAQTASTLGILIGLLTASKAAEAAAFDTYIARIETVIGKFKANNLASADWDAYVNEGTTALSAFDSRQGALSTPIIVTPRDTPIVPVNLGAPEDPNADEYKPNKKDPTTLWGSNFPQLNLWMTVHPTRIPSKNSPALPSNAPGSHPLPVTQVAPVDVALVPKAAPPPIEVNFEWISSLAIDHIEMRVYEAGISEDATKKTVDFTYRSRPDGTLASRTRFAIVAPDPGIMKRLVVEAAAVTIDGQYLSTCAQAIVSTYDGKINGSQVELPSSGGLFGGTSRCELKYPFPKWDFAPDFVPDDYILITRNPSTFPFRPLARKIAPATTKFFVHNTSNTTTWRLRSVYTPTWTDSGFASIGDGPAIDTGDIPPLTTKEVTIPAGGTVKQWLLADPGHAQFGVLLYRE